jgi:hypothetical protein
MDCSATPNDPPGRRSAAKEAPDFAASSGLLATRAELTPADRLANQVPKSGRLENRL